MPTPRKTDGMHKLTGTRSQAHAEPDPLPATRPRLPKDLTAEALAIFKRLCALLRQRRALTAGDGELLRVYAMTYDRHRKAMAHIEAEGEIRTYTIIVKGAAQEIEKENLWLKIAFTAEKNMVAILDRLGLTPHNRGKIKPTAEPDRKPVDEFDEFLAPRRTTPRPAMTPIAVPDSTPEVEL